MPETRVGHAPSSRPTENKLLFASDNYAGVHPEILPLFDPTLASIEKLKRLLADTAKINEKIEVIVEEKRKYELLIKASGGIRTKEFARELMAAGANRIGTSHSVELVSGKKLAASEKY